MNFSAWINRSAESAEAMRNLGAEFAQTWAENDYSMARLMALTGPLGAGKTIFTQGIAQYLAIDQPIVSPTFTLARQYPVPRSAERPELPAGLLHVDLYRLLEVDDWSNQLDGLEIDAAMEQNYWVVVEWGGRLKDYFDQVWELKFSIEENGGRRVTIS